MHISSGGLGHCRHSDIFTIVFFGWGTVTIEAYISVYISAVYPGLLDLVLTKHAQFFNLHVLGTLMEFLSIKISKCI